MNFFVHRYEILSPADNQWGFPKPDGTITGIVGLVARREAHFAINELTITGKINDNGSKLIV